MSIVGNFFLEMSYRVSMFIVRSIIKMDGIFHFGLIEWLDKDADMDE